MIEIQFKGEYVGPEIDVIEIKSQGVICESIFDGDHQPYDEGTWQW